MASKGYKVQPLPQDPRHDTVQVLFQLFIPEHTYISYINLYIHMHMHVDMFLEADICCLTQKSWHYMYLNINTLLLFLRNDADNALWWGLHCGFGYLIFLLAASLA